MLRLESGLCYIEIQYQNRDNKIRFSQVFTRKRDLKNKKLMAVLGLRTHSPTHGQIWFVFLYFLEEGLWFM